MAVNMIDTEALFKHKQNLAKFLEEHPELRDLQLQIDASLRKCGNNHNNRMVVLRQAMVDKLLELGEACREVVQLSNSFKEKYSDIIHPK